MTTQCQCLVVITCDLDPKERSINIISGKSVQLRLYFSLWNYTGQHWRKRLLWLTSCRMDEKENFMVEISQILWITLAPVIFVSGCLGNVLILIVLRRGTVSTTTTNFYVTLIAAADLIVLLIGLPNEWLKVSINFISCCILFARTQ